mmetsp:Transcript_12555/g.22745  ORF Transcript_12555/g.22745 Transcript_12555/m.22745 type:complete len:108 (+) Transcript_12555:621-944(+)
MNPNAPSTDTLKVIMDPNLHWDKSFISPSSSKKAKSTLNDRATFWKPIPKHNNNSTTTKILVAPSGANSTDVIKPTSKLKETKIPQSNVRTLNTFFGHQATSKSLLE